MKIFGSMKVFNKCFLSKKKMSIRSKAGAHFFLLKSQRFSKESQKSQGSISRGRKAPYMP
jgi:hypothetical protein